MIKFLISAKTVAKHPTEPSLCQHNTAGVFHSYRALLAPDM